MKTYMPSMREKSRYLVYEVYSNSRFIKNRIIKAVRNSLIAFLGEFGVSEISLVILDWSDSHQRGILKINNKHADKVIAGISLISGIDDEKVAFHTIALCGTIKKAKRILEKKQIAKNKL